MIPSDGEALFPDVPRETWLKLNELVGLVEKWQPAVNLISGRSLVEIWHRHVLDSLQLVALAPEESRRWIDLGSGGGFPGLVVAAASPSLAVELVESDQRKSAFLREAARILKLNVKVHAARIETVTQGLVTPFDVVSARALAPLIKLVDLASPVLKTGAIGIFPKGQDAARELTEAGKSWMIQHRLVPSITDAQARIVVIEKAARLSPPDGT